MEIYFNEFSILFVTFTEAFHWFFTFVRNLAIGIGIQNFPEGMAVSIPLAAAGYSPLKSFWYVDINMTLLNYCFSKNLEKQLKVNQANSIFQVTSLKHRLDNISFIQVVLFYEKYNLQSNQHLVSVLNNRASIKNNPEKILLFPGQIYPYLIVLTTFHFTGTLW